MGAERLTGAPLAEAVLKESTERALVLAGRGIVPTLALVRVGEDPASIVYLRRKREACAAVGIRSLDFELPATLTPAALLERIRGLNADPTIHGILVQFPLPAGLSESEAILAIDPGKDVDGFHPLNAGRLVSGLPAFIPCTPLGVYHLLRHAGVATEGRHVVIVGRSNIVGRPLANLLSGRGADATVTLCHSRTRDLGHHCRTADILVAAMGRPRAITGDMVKPGAVVVDVGINRVPDASAPRGHRLVGDVDRESVEPVAAQLTPVPGGVGPLTVAFLCRNTVAAAAGEWSPV